MQPVAPVVWMPASAYQQCAQEAGAFYPLETGGTFMGYWSNNEEVVITRLIPAGPSARRRHHSFEPDQEWQLERIAEHYEATDRRDDYLGDWHTHPDASSGNLSNTDRVVLLKIIQTPRARASRPLSMILFGGPSAWRPCIWVASLPKRGLFRRRLETDCGSMRLF